MTTRKEKAAAFQEEGYNVSVTGRHVLVTEAMKDYAIEKVSRIERFTSNILDVSILMDVIKLEHKVDIVMQVNHLKIKSSAVTTDMYASIDLAVDKIQTQLLKYKKKIQDHQARGVNTIDMTVNVIRPQLEKEELHEVNDEIEEYNHSNGVENFRPHRVVQSETKPLKTITVDEAIMKMELSQDAFLVYRSEENQKIRVMYRRDDGNFGIIQPES